MFLLLLYGILFLSSLTTLAEVEMPTVAPIDAPKGTDEVVIGFFTQRFSGSRRYENCDDDDPKKVHTVVKYFWPGSLVEFECLFCDKNIIEDERAKVWRIMTIPDAFAIHLKATQENWQFNKPLSDKWKNVKDFAKKDLPNLHKKFLWPPLGNEDKPMPRFFQKEGKLMITHPGIEIQGFYNCYLDPSSKIEVVHLLIAMAPMTNAPCSFVHAWSQNTKGPRQKTDNIDPEYNDWCYYDGKLYIYPAQNWVYFDSVWHNRFIPVPAPKVVQNLDHEIDSIPTYTNLNLKLFFSWSAWSECSACRPFKGWRRRDGHCSIIKTIAQENIPPRPKVEPDDLSLFKKGLDPYCCPKTKLESKPSLKERIEERYAQIKLTSLPLESLNDVLKSDLLPFADNGIRIHSTFMLDFLCNRSHDIRESSDCTFQWFKFIFNSMPRFPADSTTPKSDHVFIPCFDYRMWDESDSACSTSAVYSKHDALGEFTGGYYVDTEPCLRDCPKLNKYFP